MWQTDRRKDQGQWTFRMMTTAHAVLRGRKDCTQRSTNALTTVTFNVRLRASSWLHFWWLRGGDGGGTAGSEDGGCWGSVLLSVGDGHVLTQRVRRLAVMSRLSPSMSTFDRRSVVNNSQTSVSAVNISSLLASHLTVWLYLHGLLPAPFLLS